jgi:hypothetical protein
MKYIFLALLFLTLTPLSAFAAQKPWCVTTTPPSINIHTSTDQISYDFTKSEKDLDKFSVTTVNPYGDSVITDVGGLMHGGIQTQQKMTYGTITNPRTREICYWHNEMDIYIHIKPTIYIANNFPRGSCMHNAILAHEHKHVIVDREIVNKYATLIGNAVKDDITRYRIYGPVPLSQKSVVEEQLKQRMQIILKSYTDRMSTERKARQQQVDNLSEYERVNHLCPKQKR